MKKTIAALALSAASSSLALTPEPTETKTICLKVYESETNVQFAGNCDESANNATTGAKILENGCAQGQIALISQSYGNGFDIKISSCLPPNVSQL